MQEICGIIPCGLPVQFPGAVTCAEPSHVEWHKKWMNCFKRLSFPGVQRVIRCQNIAVTENPDTNANPNVNPDPNAPTLQVSLPPLQDTPGANVVHTFRARSTYCIQTVQWACGTPIGWGKCYESESAP